MPPSPLTTALRPASQASCSARHAASRPISRGGSSTLAGRPWAGTGNAGTPAALIVASSASVSADGAVPTSSFSICSQRSNASRAAARSPCR